MLAAIPLCLSPACQCVSTGTTTEQYVWQMPYTPTRDAELEQSSRKKVAALQALASSCKNVRLVIGWDLFTGQILQGTEVPLTESETAEWLSLIGRIQPIKPDLCAFGVNIGETCLVKESLKNKITPFFLLKGLLNSNDKWN